MEYFFQNYDGAFFALYFLKSAVRDFDHELRICDIYGIEYGERLPRILGEIVFWTNEFYRRRELARKARKYNNEPGTRN